MSWNVDGLSVSDSSKGEMWLIQAQVLNIPPQNRRNYQFLLGIYYNAVSKLDMSSFLKPFTDGLVDSFHNEIKWYDKYDKVVQKSKIIALVATLDCPARAAALNFMNYNGSYPCNVCEHPGETCKTGLGHNRVFPALEMEPNERTDESILEQAQSAIDENCENIQGVKDPSIAKKIPYFDASKSFVQDYVHAVLLGNVKMLMTLWFDTKNKAKEFYLRKPIRDAIDKEIQDIQVPDFVVRTPRVLKLKKFFKASEYRAFLLFYFPVILKDKLPAKYYQHFLLLSYAIHLLLQEKIHRREIFHANILLRLYSDYIEEL